MSQGFRAYQEVEESQQESLQEIERDSAAHTEAAGSSQAAGNFDIMCEDRDLFCESHLHLASEAALQRKRQMQKRLAFVQDLWNDAERFDAVVASGRYLKLCNLTEWISDHDERAWERVKSEILAAWQADAAEA